MSSDEWKVLIVLQSRCSGSSRHKKDAVSKDSAEGANKRLSELLSAMDNLHFRVLKVETDGFAFELSIRSVRYEDEA